MNEGSPGPALQLFFTDAQVFKPALIEKAELALRIGTVQEGRSRLDDAPQQVFGGSSWLKLADAYRRNGLDSVDSWHVIMGRLLRPSSEKPRRDLQNWMSPLK